MSASNEAHRKLVKERAARQGALAHFYNDQRAMLAEQLRAEQQERDFLALTPTLAPALALTLALALTPTLDPNPSPHPSPSPSPSLSLSLSRSATSARGRSSPSPPS